MKRQYKDFHCQVCDRDYPAIRLPGNHKSRKRMCDDCRKWHKWCTNCEVPRLRSEFAICSKAADGLQTYCNRCLTRMRGNVRIRECFSCSGQFMLTNSASFNGRAHWMCEECTTQVKFCMKCSTLKPRADFNRAKDKAHGLSAHCRECQAVAWAAKPRPERRRAKLRARGLTHDEYQAMHKLQGGLCAICKSPETDRFRTTGVAVRELAIDHDHKTGAVRALLCGRCNKAIGLMLDDPDRLVAAAAYLQAWPTPPLQL